MAKALRGEETCKRWDLNPRPLDFEAHPPALSQAPLCWSPLQSPDGGRLLRLWLKGCQWVRIRSPRPGLLTTPLVDSSDRSQESVSESAVWNDGRRGGSQQGVSLEKPV